jgi:hypothetical protein
LSSLLLGLLIEAAAAKGKSISGRKTYRED